MNVYHLISSRASDLPFNINRLAIMLRVVAIADILKLYNGIFIVDGLISEFPSVAEVNIQYWNAYFFMFRALRWTYKYPYLARRIIWKEFGKQSFSVNFLYKMLKNLIIITTINKYIIGLFRNTSISFFFILTRLSIFLSSIPL